nr:hypothetical protein [Phytohabitans suffuscus]
MALLAGVVGVRLFGGVRAQQVVEGVAAGQVFGGEVGVAELGQESPCAAGGHGGEAGGGGRADVRAGMQAEQPEEPGRVGCEGVVGPGEHGADVGGAVTGEGVEPVGAVAQLVGEGGEAAVRVGGGAGRDQGQGQREPGAPGDDAGGGGGLGREAVLAQAPGQQLVGVGGGEQVQRHGVRAVGGDETGQLVAAGDDDRAAGRAGQQRADLVGVAGVVEHDQHAFAGYQGAVQADLRVQAVGDRRGWHTECLQERVHRRQRRHRRARRVEPA